MAYSEQQKTDVFNDICSRISKGASLRTVLLNDDMPSTSTFYIWLDEDKSKSKQYTRACEDRADKMADEILEIADNENVDVTVDDDGKIQIRGSVVQRSRLQIDARKWLMSKLQPKKYGDKIQQEHSGEIEVKTITGMQIK